MGDLRRRLSEMPDTVHTFVIGLAVVALYLATSAVLEFFGVSAGLPLAPPPRLALCAALANAGLSIGLFNAFGWVRGLVTLVPLAMYPMQYGLSVPKLWSIQSAELLTVVVLMPAIVVYFLYFEEDVRRWFAKGRTE